MWKVYAVADVLDGKGERKKISLFGVSGRINDLMVTYIPFTLLYLRRVDPGKDYVL